MPAADSIGNAGWGLVSLATRLSEGDLAAKAPCTGRRCPIKR
jgi:hypothetical protein